MQSSLIKACEEEGTIQSYFSVRMESFKSLRKKSKFPSVPFYLGKSRRRFPIINFWVEKFVQTAKSNNIWPIFVIWISQPHFYSKPRRPSCLETNIFKLKMMVKSGLEFFYFEILIAPSDLLLPSSKKSAQKGWIGLASFQVTVKGLVELKKIKI